MILYHPIATPVGLLFTFRHPFAVIRRIWPIIINSLNTMVDCRTSAHIGKKVFKFCPAFGYKNSTAAVIFKPLTLRIFASLSHTFPYSVFWTSLAMAQLSMFNIQRFVSFESQATTGSRFTATKFISQYDSGIAAIAKTKPASLAEGINVNFLFYQEPSKFLSN